MKRLEFLGGDLSIGKDSGKYELSFFSNSDWRGGSGQFSKEEILQMALAMIEVIEYKEDSSLAESASYLRGYLQTINSLRKAGLSDD